MYVEFLTSYWKNGYHKDEKPPEILTSNWLYGK